MMLYPISNELFELAYRQMNQSERDEYYLYATIGDKDKNVPQKELVITLSEKQWNRLQHFKQTMIDKYIRFIRPQDILIREYLPLKIDGFDYDLLITMQ